MDNSDAKRDAIHEAIQANGTVEGGMLTGWALVSEWMDQDGERWLARAHSASTASWEAKGMWHDALHGDWPERNDA